MRNIFLVLMFSKLLIACKTFVNINAIKEKAIYDSVQIDTLFQDNISIRSLIINDNKIWYTADNSRFGFYDLNKKVKFEDKITNDSLKLEFRSGAQTQKNIFTLSVSNPALLYKIDKKDFKVTRVYQENQEKVFYDSMQFWNDKEGIAMGDPIDNCLSIIITRDGGDTWHKISCDDLPVIEQGEAAFAASNTNIVIDGNSTWIVTGGKKARVLKSMDKGKTWKIYKTPIVQGKTMTGIFTADFYDSNQGFIAGGDYELQNQNFGNKARTIDGGKTWKLIAENHFFGFTSCIQYMPNSGGKSLVSVGGSGMYYSYDSGENWIQFSTDSSLYTIRFINNNTAIAAGKNKMIRLKFVK